MAVKLVEGTRMAPDFWGDLVERPKLTTECGRLVVYPHQGRAGRRDYYVYHVSADACLWGGIKMSDARAVIEALLASDIDWTAIDRDAVISATSGILGELKNRYPGRYDKSLEILSTFNRPMPVDGWK